MRLTPPPSTLRAPARKAAALAGAGALVLLAASPGSAAEPVAEASATGLVLTVLNTPTDSGSFTATNDGEDETTSGSRNPLITALANQSFIQAGTLSQDAATSATSRGGKAVACAGLAGDGATLLSVENGFCLDPANNAQINAGTLKLADVQLVQSEVLQGLDAQLQAALQPLLTPVLTAVDGAVDQVLTALGDPDIVLDLGTVQSQCTADLTDALGASQLTNASLYIDLPAPAGRVTLIDFPTAPAPNTKLLTDLDDVVAEINSGLQTQLEQGLAGILAPLGPVADEIITTINDNVIAAVADQLGPLEDNILDVTLNKQTTGNRSIEVTALDLRLLPAAAQFVDLVNIEIGRSSCEAAPRAAVPTEDPTPTDDPTNPDNPTPAIPTSVPAGEFSPTGGSSNGAVNAAIATGALVLLSLLAAVGGTYGFRRVLKG